MNTRAKIFKDGLVKKYLSKLNESGNEFKIGENLV